MHQRERVLYFEAFLVTDPGSTPLIKKQLLTEEMYFDALDQYGDDEFVAKMGAEAMQDVLSEMQLEKEATNSLVLYPANLVMIKHGPPFV